MSKPGIPLDIVEAARAVYAKLGRGSTADEAVIAQALAAERERCLSTIEEIRVSPEWSGQDADWICGAAKDAIRQGGAS